MKAGTPTLPAGDTTDVWNPDPDRLGAFKRVGRIIGTPDNVTLPVMARYTSDLSRLLRIVKNGCDHDLQVHIGTCQDPRDFNRGWDKVLVIEAARADGWSTDNDLGALGPDERVTVNEQTTFSGIDMYEIGKQSFTELAGAQITTEVVDIVVCDRVSCGSCGIVSNGCDKVFAVQVAGSGSPAGGVELAFSQDGGGTWDRTDVTTLGTTDDPTAMACIGSNLVIVSNDSESLHVAPIADILAGTETWTEVDEGAAGGLNDLVAMGPSNVWVVGDGGYVYYTANVEDGLTPLTEGTVTAQDLLAIDAYDVNNLVAVGASNAVLNSRDGGTTWSLVVGPATGIAINAVAMKSADEWLVGLANGAMYATRDGGANWTVRVLPGNVTSVNKIVFPTPTVGYAGVSTGATKGQVLKTINGGRTWYVGPEGSATMPGNDRINSVAICEDPNIFFAGGLGDNATDGFIVKGAGTYGKVG
jgi:hypothetical protein